MNCIALFNHEEIGSVSTSGAESSLIPFLLQRLSPGSGAYAQSVARSFLISCDMGHAIHPNYTSRHEDNHAPLINGGVVIKTNAKQRYASDAIGSFVVKKLIEKKGGQVQEYEVRNDMYVFCAPYRTFAILNAQCIVGRVAPRSDRSYPRSVCVRWTSALLCSLCTRSARLLERMTCKVR